jgi:6-pyruvoyltetrahydropterin/6-carboxytetrahydropterin synthase
MSEMLVTKKINFVAGHRVHSQNLPKSLGPNKCRFLHGHEYVLELFVTSDLDESGMVLDFTFFNYLNDFIQRFIDHRFILDINDPLFASITGVINNRLDCRSKCLVHYTITEMDGKIELTSTDKEKSLFSTFNRYYREFNDEHKQSFIIVDFVPTAENLCYWFAKVFDRMKTIGLIPANIQLSKIRLHETQKAYVELIL